MGRRRFLSYNLSNDAVKRNSRDDKDEDVDDYDDYDLGGECIKKALFSKLSVRVKKKDVRDSLNET